MKTCRIIVGVLLVAIGILIGCIWKLELDYNLERLDARLAWNTVMDYERCTTSASHMSVNEAAGILDYVAHVGLRVRSPHLNMIMDRERARAICEIISDLRTKTGDNLGDDPEVWIKKYEIKRHEGVSPE